MVGTDDATEPAARKVQQTGGTTFTVSLPKDWATDQGLAAGSTVYLYPFEDRVVVAPGERQRGDRQIELDTAGLHPDAVERDVQRAYAAGYDAIVLEGGDGGLSDGHRSAAADALTGLIGMQIVEEGPVGLEARCTLDASAVSLDQTLAQLCQQTLSALRESVRALTDADLDAARGADERVGEVERLVALVERQFQGALVDVREVDQLERDRSGAYRQLTVAHALADAAAAADALTTVARAQSSAPGDDLRSGFVAAGDAVRDAIRAAFDVDELAARDAVDEARDLIADIDNGLVGLTDADAHRYGRALAALERATEAAGGLSPVQICAAET